MSTMAIGRIIPPAGPVLDDPLDELASQRARRVREIRRLVRSGRYDFERKLAAAIPRLLLDVFRPELGVRPRSSR